MRDHIHAQLTVGRPVSRARIINNAICAKQILREFGDPCGRIADQEI